MLKTAAAVCAIAALLLIDVGGRTPAQAIPNLTLTGVANDTVTKVRKGHGDRHHHMARSRARGRHHIGRHHMGRHHHGIYRHYRHHHFRGGYYGGVWIGHRCQWLRHRAIVTGSAYWWRRYHRCRYGW